MTQADSAGRRATGEPLRQPIREAHLLPGGRRRGQGPELLTASREKIDQIRKKSLEENLRRHKTTSGRTPGRASWARWRRGFILGRILRRR